MRPPVWGVHAIDESLASALALQIGVRPLTARILVGRGIAEPAVAARFLEPRLAHLRPPEGMADLDRTCDRLVAALERGERVGVFGDYDVDGVTTAAILALTLRGLGGEVIARVASRASGYGLGPADAARFADEGCRVLVTGDCGTSDHEALALCRERGVDAIVIDHHQVPARETAAHAMINPHRRDDRFPFKGLASCGVAFYVAASLRSRLRAAGRASAEAFDPRDLLDLVALGSIADIVPLVDENRILVGVGLRVLAERRRPGLRALCDVAELEPGPIDSHDVGFRLTPRLNAAGRLGEAQDALDLLLATTDEDARRRALDLDDQNRERQRIQELVVTEAIAAADENGDDAAVVVGAEGWHHGVVGIVAARLVERYGRPAIVVGFHEGHGRGSARTISGFNLYEALAACAQHLSKFGGHAAAAGMSVDIDRFPAFRQAFLLEARRRLDDPAFRAASLTVDAVADLGELDAALAEELARLGPFGAANAEPLLALRGVTARTTRVVGNKHLQLTLARDGATGDAIAFGMADRDPGSGTSLDVLASAQLDTFRGNRRARLRVKHLYRID